MTGQPYLFDRLLALLGIAVTSPAWLLAAIGIKVSDRGPVLYRARRAGLAGRPFHMLKFRTMRVASATSTGSRITGGRDRRVFLVGRWLRRLKLDELPQLINIFRGEMAIVGPRPEDVTIVAHHYEPWMRETLARLPGLTSPGSLSYFADEGSLPDDSEEAERIYLERLLPLKLAVDLAYVRRASRTYDAALVLRTLLGIVGWRRPFAAQERREASEGARILAEMSTS